MKTTYLMTLSALISLLLLPACVNDHSNSSSSDVDWSYSTNKEDSSYSEKGQYRFEKRTVALENATGAKIDLSFPSGYFNLGSETHNLLEAKLKYRKDQRRVSLSQTMDEKIAEIKLKLPKTVDYELHDEKNIANIQLNKSIPIELKLSFGAGEGRFNLEETNVKKASFDLGAGQFNVNLRNSAITKLEFNAGVGEGIADLSGEWKHNLDAEFNCGIGSLKLKLPSKAGVRVTISGVLGNVDHSGLNKHGNTYTNSAWEDSPFKLDIDINGAIGDIDLVVEDE
jgi:hypothetical protein